MYHPAWDKIYGDPAEPATSIVFGEKGSGKTALRLQIAQHLADYNRRIRKAAAVRHRIRRFQSVSRPLSRPLGGRRRRLDRMLAEWKLWDHMDAILSLGVTRLDDDILGRPRAALRRATGGCDRHQSPRSAAVGRLLRPIADRHARRAAGIACGASCAISTWWSHWDLALGIAVTVAIAAPDRRLGATGTGSTTPWPYLLALAGLGAAAVAHLEVVLAGAGRSSAGCAWAICTSTRCGRC